MKIQLGSAARWGHGARVRFLGAVAMCALAVNPTPLVHTQPDARLPARSAPTAPATTTAAPTSAEAHGEVGIAMGGPWTWAPSAQQAADLDQLAALGVDWVRVSFPWSSMERRPGRYDWRVHDTIVRLAYERGLGVLANVSYTPAWARPAGCFSIKCGPADPAAFAGFVGKVVERYGTSAVDAVEVWNEPNLAHFWKPLPDAAAFAALVRAADAEANRVNPDVTVVSGGLAPATRDTPGAVTPLTFLSRIYAAGGIDVDAVGAHPYSFPRRPLDPHPTNSFGQLPALHSLMVANDDADTPIWITELGYWTSDAAGLRPPGSVTPDQQAAYLTEAFTAAHGWPWTGPMVWYAYRDQSALPLSREDSFGLVRFDGTPKPALGALRSVLRERSRSR